MPFVTIDEPRIPQTMPNNYLTPLPSSDAYTQPLTFLHDDTCTDPNHGYFGTADGDCLNCTAEKAAHDARWATGPFTIDDIVRQELWQTKAYAEFSWLVARIRALSKALHRDSEYLLTSPELQPNYPPNPTAKRKISYATRKRVMERDEYRCVACSTHVDLTIDHIHPETNGGTSDDDNLQTLCKSCNSSKGVKSMEEWEAWREAQ